MCRVFLDASRVTQHTFNRSPKSVLAFGEIHLRIINKIYREGRYTTEIIELSAHSLTQRDFGSLLQKKTFFRV